MIHTDYHTNLEHQQMIGAMLDALYEVKGAWDRLSSLIDASLRNLRYRYAFKFCVWISGEDILQDVKFKVHRKLVRARAIRNSEVREETIQRMARSVKRMGRQALIDQIRRLKGDTKPERDVSLDEERGEAYEAFFAVRAGVEEKVLLNELQSSLTDLERDVLYRSLIEEESYRSIGADLGLDKNRVQRIRKGALSKLVQAIRRPVRDLARRPRSYMLVDLTSEHQDSPK